MRQWEQNHFPQIAFSPLNPAAPEMAPMTFHGMNMLHTLWKKTNCKVPPLHEAKHTGPVLLETMPGVLLHTFCLPAKDYKKPNKSNEGDPKSVRCEILDGLEKKTLPVMLRIPDNIRKQCIENDDCLDSLVAAIGAALWAKDESLFHRPEDHHGDPALRAAAQMEGCIYAPKAVKKMTSASLALDV